MKLYFIRHGETDWNDQGLIQGQTNNQLNTTGISQAKDTAIKLKGEKPAAFYSSPLDRAHDTMQIIKEENNWAGNIEFKEDFMERDFGEFEGVKAEEFLSVKKEKGVDATLYPKYEQDKDIEIRVNRSLKEIINKHNNEDDLVLVTAHAHTIKALLASNFPSEFEYTYHLPNCAVIKLDVDENGNIKFNEII